MKEGRKGKVATGVDQGKGCRGCAPPLPEMTCDCFIDVEVKHETKLRNSCEIQQPLKIICILGSSHCYYDRLINLLSKNILTLQLVS